MDDVRDLLTHYVDNSQPEEGGAAGEAHRLRKDRQAEWDLAKSQVTRLLLSVRQS